MRTGCSAESTYIDSNINIGLQRHMIWCAFGACIRPHHVKTSTQSVMFDPGMRLVRALSCSVPNPSAVLAAGCRT
jgi:hypothetical protein